MSQADSEVPDAEVVEAIALVRGRIDDRILVRCHHGYRR